MRPQVTTGQVTNRERERASGSTRLDLLDEEVDWIASGLRGDTPAN